MSFPTRTPISSRASSACAARPSSIRWGGTTTACRPSGACRTTSASAAYPELPYDPAFTPPEKPDKQPISVSRPNFVELCQRLTAEDEKAFEFLWRHLGLSVDWALTYATIRKHALRVSQLSFLRLLGRGGAYQLEAPTLWDIDFRTAVAQAELEDRVCPAPITESVRARRWLGHGRDRHHPAGTDPRLRRPRGPSGLSPVSAALRPVGHHPALSGPCPCIRIRWPILRRAPVSR